MTENRIKEIREKANLSQTELARLTKVAAQNLSAVENGRLAAWPKLKKALAKSLKTTVIELFPEN